MTSVLVKSLSEMSLRKSFRSSQLSPLVRQNLSEADRGRRSRSVPAAAAEREATKERKETVTCS